MSVMETQRLVQTINDCIAIRGIYALLDDRLDLVCGRNALQQKDSREIPQQVARFAAAHGWSVTRYQEGFLFWPDGADGPIPKARSGPPSGPSACAPVP